MKKRIISIFFVLAMMLNISACGKDTSKGTLNTTLPLGESDFAYTVIYGEDNAEDLSDSVSFLTAVTVKQYSV